ncbi:hypothetical protein SAICODRAFT_28490 [Saitoella complicata NRRL Y-17804]|uniref:Uncharacterized protein n=1 Tax=Saitoella complicata (strain BCRC 22490 / CBS 7301 / JCM 7358 / NBRC 10748 / NRRL Y-17804) TaxID=698492 RepID=A0A0E9NP67_SAICN|nr:uncharacterized protein SAICODRAFT_28490 [Saitoella complicata NRRL Y-17804]ODQ56270.1 hypothetical protein SAICODRAFT_28490 [Saitoella complicata NRRL Y-17804]GAO51461.1 hypothetical protein G7K_5561-t1 [Saitoella complicata NRRL Y-17804]
MSASSKLGLATPVFTTTYFNTSSPNLSFTLRPTGPTMPISNHWTSTDSVPTFDLGPAAVELREEMVLGMWEHPVHFHTPIGGNSPMGFATDSGYTDAVDATVGAISPLELPPPLTPSYIPPSTPILRSTSRRNPPPALEQLPKLTFSSSIESNSSTESATAGTPHPPPGPVRHISFASDTITRPTGLDAHHSVHLHTGRGRAPSPHPNVLARAFKKHKTQREGHVGVGESGGERKGVSIGEKVAGVLGVGIRVRKGLWMQ